MRKMTDYRTSSNMSSMRDRNPEAVLAGQRGRCTFCSLSHNVIVRTGDGGIVLVTLKKYHGLGNDYLIYDPNQNRELLQERQIQLLCRRNTGVGADGILFGPVLENEKIKVRIFNPDGSEAERSGNGIRIFSKYLKDAGLQVGEHIDSSFYKVKTFTEKPELELAKVFIESGEFYWNAGLFMWNVNSIIKAGELLLPELATKLAAGKDVYGTPEEKKFIDENFPACPNVSIDFGIMEKADNVYVSLGDFGWSDLGTWGSLYDLSQKDESENVTLKCRSLLYNSKNNIVVLPQNKLAVIDGLEGYLIAESDNVLLICKKDEEHSIRKYVNDAQIKLGEDYI